MGHLEGVVEFALRICFGVLLDSTLIPISSRVLSLMIDLIIQPKLDEWLIPRCFIMK